MKYELSIVDTLELVQLLKDELNKINGLVEKYAGSAFAEFNLKRRSTILDLITKFTGIKEDNANEKTL